MKGFGAVAMAVSSRLLSVGALDEAGRSPSEVRAGPSAAAAAADSANACRGNQYEYRDAQRRINKPLWPRGAEERRRSDPCPFLRAGLFSSIAEVWCMLAENGALHVFAL